MTTNKTIEHFWQPDPDIAIASKGGQEQGGTKVVYVHDANVMQLMTEVLTELKKIEYHLSLMTDADLKKGDI